MNDNDLFANVKVRELSRDDFYIGSRTPTMLRSRNCTMVLFYLPYDQTSVDMVSIWEDLSATIAGVDFTTVNASRQKDIMQAFNDTRNDPNHPLRDFYVIGFPTILIFRDGWPQAYYNDELSYEALSNFALTRACDNTYYDNNQTYSEDGSSYSSGGYSNAYYQDYEQDIDVVDVDVNTIEEIGLL